MATSFVTKHGTWVLVVTMLAGGCAHVTSVDRSDPVSGATTPSQNGPSAAPPSPVQPEGFLCASTSGGATHASDWPVTGPRVRAVQLGQHGGANDPDGFDRFMMEFDATVPSYRVTLLDESPELLGTHDVVIELTPIDSLAYHGTEHLNPTMARIREVRLVENFEGHQQWRLGTRGSPCLRVRTLTDPDRLVIDVTSPE